jgi:hypothetical protein
MPEQESGGPMGLEFDADGNRHPEYADKIIAETSGDIFENDPTLERAEEKHGEKIHVVDTRMNEGGRVAFERKRGYANTEAKEAGEEVEWANENR